MTIVHCKRSPFTHYIGRPSVLGNPFSHKRNTLARHKCSSVEEAIRAFENWAPTNTAVMQAIRELPGDAVLGCWCSPKLCHGYSIMRIWNQLHGFLIETGVPEEFTLLRNDGEVVYQNASDRSRQSGE